MFNFNVQKAYDMNEDQRKRNETQGKFCSLIFPLLCLKYYTSYTPEQSIQISRKEKKLYSLSVFHLKSTMNNNFGNKFKFNLTFIIWYPVKSELGYKKKFPNK